MKNLNVPCIVDGKETIRKETVYNIDDYPYNEIAINIETVRKKRKSAVSYISAPATFDIESTTIKSETPYAYMYHWQFCLCGFVVFGTTWEEFITFLNTLGEKLELDEHKQLVIYVHNLAYEFMFIKDYLYIYNLFAKAAHKVIKFTAHTLNNYLSVVNSINVSRETLPTFEFRCSYFLSNMGLSKFCENSKMCIHYKLVDTYDYSKIRHCMTPATEEELAYDYNDVKGLEECILSKMHDYNDNIATIPLTSTGFVRRTMRNAVAGNSEYRELFESLALDENVYNLLRQAFRGGNTHASRFYADIVIKDVYSMDLCSSYPARMVCGKYPMTPFIPYKPKNLADLLSMCNKKAVVMKVTFNNIRLRDEVVVPYMDFGHCTNFSSDYVNDNGRLLYAKWSTYACTEIDFKIICNQYEFDSIEWVDGYCADKDYLPKPIVDTILQWYDNKTQLKDIADKEYEYMKSKNELNATFGMMVTDILHSEIIYEDGDWKEIKPDAQEELEKYFNSRNNFLPYQWGVYVTANARYELQLMIDAVGDDFVYCDTDSVKFINKEHIKRFEERNDYILSLDYKYRNYSDRENSDGTTKRYYLGIWEYDGHYSEFKTLGAKKYCYIDAEDKKLHVTVSGLSKKKGVEELNKNDGINSFKIGQVFTDSGRTTSYFNECESHNITITDYNNKTATFNTASNIAIVDTTYTLGITDEYAEVLGIATDSVNPYK